MMVDSLFARPVSTTGSTPSVQGRSDGGNSFGKQDARVQVHVWSLELGAIFCICILFL
jgi:hypothetical protein